MFNNKADKLVEATMLALQGKLELKENKSSNKKADKFIRDYFQHKFDLETLHNKLTPLFNSKKDAVEYLADNESRIKKEIKKTEGIDVNIDEKTAVSVDDGMTVVETEDATIMITEPQKQPEESVEAPIDSPVEEPETVEVPVDDTVMPEEILDEPVDTELPVETEPTIDDIVNDDAPIDTINDEEDEEKDESKKVESKSKKEETLGYHAGMCPNCKSDDLSYEEPVVYEDGMEYPFHCNSCDADGVERYNIDYVESETNELEENKKVEAKDEKYKEPKTENVEIEVSDDGKEIEVTTDDHEEVEVKDETPEEDDETEEDEELSVPEDGNENIEGEEIIDDELVDECKKITESDDYGSALYGPKYIASVTTEVAQNIDSLNNDTKYQDAIKDEDKLNLVVDSIMDDDELWNTLQETIVYYIDELIAGNLTESKKVEKINKNNFEINNAIANPQLKANRETIRKAGYETDKKSVTNPRNGRTFQTKYAPNKDKIDWKNRLDKDKTDYEAIVGPESDKIPNSRKINQKSTTATYSKADADAYGVKYSPKDECDRVVEDTDYALEPRYASAKSFYGKARVRQKDNGDEELYSYGTHVGGMRNGKPYSKGKFSSTTSRHQAEYFKQKGVDPKKVDVEEGKTCKECDEKLEAFKAKSRANRKATFEAKRIKKTENVETDDARDLGITEGVPKTEEPVPNTTEVKTENRLKFAGKTFNEALTKFFKSQYKTVESVKVTKIAQNKNGDLKIEANLINMTKKSKNICLEMLKAQSGKSFIKYTLKESKGLMKEHKVNDSKITMMTFKNKQNILECRYLLKK